MVHAFLGQCNFPLLPVSGWWFDGPRGNDESRAHAGPCNPFINIPLPASRAHLLGVGNDAL